MGTMTIPTLTEKVRLTFNRLPYNLVSHYMIYRKPMTAENFSLLTTIENTQEETSEETLLENVLVSSAGYIELPAGAKNDSQNPPIVIVNDEILESKDYTYSQYLGVIRLANRLTITDQDRVDLIYLQNIVEYEYEVVHDASVVEYQYFVEPVFRTSHQIGHHNIIE